MLARAQRLTTAPDFAAVIRRGRRAGSRTLVVHLLRGDGSAGAGQARVGLVVGKAIGNAVTRNQVKRRLRHLLRERLAALPRGSMLVVRALAPAATASSDQLGADLDVALERAWRAKGAA